LSNNNKKILIINSKHSFFSAISTYQYLINSNQIEFFNLIFSDLQQYSKHKDAIENSIKSADISSLVIIEANEDITENILPKFGKIHSKFILVCNQKRFNYYSKNSNKTADVMIKEDREYKFDDLANDSKSKLVESLVLFQNKLIKFKDLLGIEEINEITADLKEAIDLDMFNQLIKIGNGDANSDKSEIYIPRTFYRFIKLNFEIFDKKSCDVIALRESEFLNRVKSKLIKFNDIKTDFVLNPKEVIVLSKENKKCLEEFESVCLNKNFQKKNFHLLTIDENDEKLTWLKTHGSLELIKKHTLNQDSFKIEINEEFFFKISELDEKVFIISDEAGMGKTTFIQNIANNMFAVKIELNKCFSQLDGYIIKLKNDENFKFTKNRSFDEFLFKLNVFKIKLEKEILKNNLQNNENKLKLVVLFDGLDEICPYYKEAILDIIDDLKRMNTKIVVTTRPHQKNEIESHFGVISYQMNKFTYENQKTFLVNYWMGSYENLEEKVDEVLKKLSLSIKDRERELTGIPIQLKLLSEIYLERFDKNDVLNLKILYDKFIEKKFYDIHYKDKRTFNLDDPEIKESTKKKFNEFLNEHEKLAFSNLLIKEEKYRSYKEIKKLTQKYMREYIDGTKNYGIISVIIEDNVIFVHKTFEEYFCSRYLSKHLNDIEIKRLVFEKILFERDYKIIRLFLNHNRVESKDSNLKNRIVNRCLLKFVFSKIHVIECCFNAVKEGLLELVKFLVENGADVNAKYKDNNTALLLACKKSHFDIVKYLVENGAAVNANDSRSSTPLILASKNGNFEIVKFLVENGADVNAKYKADHTALVLASKNSHFEIVKFLIENGADLNAKCSDKHQPLILASKNGNLELVKYLIKNGEDVNATNNNNDTALILASKNGHLEIVKLLIESKADLDAKNDYNSTAIMLASKNDFFEIVKYLAENGADVNAKDYFNNTSLILSAKNGYFKTVKFLVEKKADINLKNQDHKSALILAYENSHFELVKFLVESGADVNVKDLYSNTPLILATIKGDLEMVKYFVLNRADVDEKYADNNTPIMLASQNGHFEIVKYLAEFSNPKCENKEKCLILASKNGHLEVVKFFADNGADINKTDFNQNTALMLASKHGRFETVKFLLAKGSDVNAKDNYRETSLLLASRNGNLEIVNFLVQNGSDVNAKDYYFNTALILASKIGHFEIVKYLVENSADVNAKNEDGNTALVLASQYGHLEIVKCLVENGAEVNARNKDNFTSLQLAARKGYFEIGKFLAENGAKDYFNETPLILDPIYWITGHFEIEKYV
jgi:ankyrin repeat protein